MTLKNRLIQAATVDWETTLAGFGVGAYAAFSALDYVHMDWKAIGTALVKILVCTFIGAILRNGLRRRPTCKDCAQKE